MLVAEAEEQIDDRGARVCIEIAGRFVREYEAGAIDQCSRDRDALLLAAGQLRREMTFAIAEADCGEQLPGASDLVEIGAVRNQRCKHVVERRERGQQVESLKDEADVPAQHRAR